MSGALFVKRWTKYGKDRLYVQTTAGEKVGWLDLATGATTLDRPDLEAAFKSAIASHDAWQVRPSDVPTPTPAAPWSDLALNQPGQQVRAEANSRYAEMREQSRLVSAVRLSAKDSADQIVARAAEHGLHLPEALIPDPWDDCPF